MKYRLLIIEDEFPILDSLAKELGTDYTIYEASNGQTGLELALEKHPDLIFLDILLPEISGEDLLVKLRQDEWGKDANVVIISNLSDTDVEKRIKNLGILDYLVKSNTSIKELSEKVVTYLKPKKGVYESINR